MRRVVSITALIIFTCAIALSTVGSSPAVANENLLRNPGFEGDYSAWQIQYGTAQMAPEWTPWWLEDSNHDPIWAQPEYKPAEQEFFGNRVREGSRAQQWFTFYKSHYGGIYQQVPGVVAGQTYRFQIWVQVWSSEADDPLESQAPGDPRLEIGIDPTGDARPGFSNAPSTVVWSGNAGKFDAIDRWHLMSIDVKAENSTITVYVKTNPEFAVKHNDIYVDAASLVSLGGTTTTPQPNPDPSPPSDGNPYISRWTNVYDSPGGSPIAGASLAPNTPVQVLERTAQGNWVRIQTDTIQGWVPSNSVANGGGSAPAAGGATVSRWTNVYQTPGGAPIVGVSLAPGTAVEVLSSNASGHWVQIRADFGTGWVPSNAVNAGTEQTPAPSPSPSPDPTPVPAPAPSSGAFGLGGQTHTFENPDLMADVGMTWVKFQHKWSNGDGPNAVSARVSDAHARGFKVLLSIPGSDHSNIDFGAYVEFLRGVAALPDPPDAIEVWNEQNIDREWPTGQISATSYVNNMLKPAYTAIKQSNPNVTVISGAPAPTGFFGGGCTDNGCDDQPYMEEMFRAGAAAYTDCIGIHYNEGILPPSQRSGDPRGNGGHYTRYFYGMIDTYYNAFQGQRPLCFTELGYLSGDDYGGLPAGFAWAGDTSIAEHAQWLAEATQLSRDDARIDMLIIFNIDFTFFDPNGDPQAGFAMIRRDGSCPSCSLIKNVMGR